MKSTQSFTIIFVSIKQGNLPSVHTCTTSAASYTSIISSMVDEIFPLSTFSFHSSNWLHELLEQIISLDRGMYNYYIPVI